MGSGTAAGSAGIDDERLTAAAEELARRLLTDANHRDSGRQRRLGRRVARLLDDPAGLALLLALTDEVLRIRHPARAARRLRDVVAGAGGLSFLGSLDRAALRAAAATAATSPRAVLALVRARLHADVGSFVGSAEPRQLTRQLTARHRQGFAVNLNLLGEAVLGDDEARRRLHAVAALLRRGDVDAVSVKISSVAAQINPAAFDVEVQRIAAALGHLYETAAACTPPRVVTLDMEEFRDLHLTVAVFRRLLGEPRFHALDAGIVLQAYLPDSLPVLHELLAWAASRQRHGGGRVKVRLVKGANLAMEQVVAELAGWEQPPFTTKAEVDANYKRLLDVALHPANAEVLRVGVATHNLFDVSWALTLADARGVRPMVELEMLQGMAPSSAAAARQVAGGLLLYTPVARRADHDSTVAYLVRRFDENTGPENFLRHQFQLTVGSPAWDDQRRRFEAAVAARRQAVPTTRWAQDRSAEERAGPARAAHSFANAPDTDFALAANRRWITGHLQPLHQLGLAVVHAVVAGQPVGPAAPGGTGPPAGPADAEPARPAGTGAELRERAVEPGEPAVEPGEAAAPGVRLADGRDPGRPDTVAYRWVQLDIAHVDRAVAAARRAQPGWAALDAVLRRQLLRAVAAELARRRGRLLAVMAAEAGKTVAEGDPEVSEAIDFANYYAEHIPGDRSAGNDPGTAADGGPAGTARFAPYGTVLVAPPWNFPLSIPAGGVTAALAAGNAVLLKPAPEAVATASVLCQACWAAGIPTDVLQFVPCADDDAGRRLVTHPEVDAVVLTGSWDTAQRFLQWRPQLHLHAETSGKNAMVITAAADLEQAVADLVRSAFGHAGQKCSAASLAVVEASVYDDRRFRRQLADATRTLRPGPGWELSTTIGPLIRPPSGPLADAVDRLGPGEWWLVEPRTVGAGGQLLSPGVKLGVQPGSPFHLTECFGPVLGLMRADDLPHAVALQNMPPYGLTAGLQSLDPAEIAWWCDHVEAGNLYVNRHITGAVVRRQPFGGWKRSVVGPGAKTGGPNTVASLGRWRTFGPAPDPATFEAAVRRVLRHQLAPADPTGLRAEANTLRYLPLRQVLLRVGVGVDTQWVELALAAARAAGVAVTLSVAEPRSGAVTFSDAATGSRSASGSGPASGSGSASGSGPAGGSGLVSVAGDDELADRLADLPGIDKLRLLGPASDRLLGAAYQAGLWVDRVPVVGEARREALRWVREQAISETLHRHGHLTARPRRG